MGRSASRRSGTPKWSVVLPSTSVFRRAFAEIAKPLGTGLQRRPRPAAAAVAADVVEVDTRSVSFERRPVPVKAPPAWRKRCQASLPASGRRTSPEHAAETLASAPNAAVSECGS